MHASRSKRIFTVSRCLRIRSNQVETIVPSKSFLESTKPFKHILQHYYFPGIFATIHLFPTKGRERSDAALSSLVGRGEGN